MNIQQLEYLIAVDKFKHFGKAAQACFITQPTLSAMIQKLEEELDLKIFDRTTHPIRTTDAGSVIIVQAREIIDAVNELKNKAHQLNNILAGKINLGIIPTIAGYLLPNEIFSFISKHPEIDLNVKEMTTDNVIKSLKSGELDAGIISTPYDAANEFYHDFLFNEELMLYASEDDCTKKEESFVAPEDIDVDKIWLLEQGNCLRTQFEHICHLKENKLKPKNLDFAASNVNTLIQMVDKLGGITIIPEMAVDQLAPSQKCKVSRFRKPFPFREVSLIYYKPTYKQRIIDELISDIKSSIEDRLNYYQSPKDYKSVKPQ